MRVCVFLGGGGEGFGRFFLPCFYLNFYFIGLVFNLLVFSVILTYGRERTEEERAELREVFKSKKI